MPDNLTDMLDAWGEGQRDAIARESTSLPAPLKAAVSRVRGDGAPVAAARLTMARWAPLAAALLLAALAGMLVTRPLNRIQPSSDSGQAAALSPMHQYTLIGLMRANQSFSTDALVLPDSGVVAWTSRTPALSQ